MSKVTKSISNINTVTKSILSDALSSAYVRSPSSKMEMEMESAHYFDFAGARVLKYDFQM